MSYLNAKISRVANHSNDQSSAENNFIQSAKDSSASYPEQKLFCIWYHDEDLNEDVKCEIYARLKSLFTYIRVFNDPCEFSAYLVGALVKKIYFFITSKLAEYLRIIATKRPQCQKVYEFQPTSFLVNETAVSSNIDKLFSEISQDIELYLNKQQSSSTTTTVSASCRELIDPPPWSIWNSKTIENSFRYGKKESPEFFLFQILTTILTRIKCDHDQSLEEMISACRLYYINDPIEVKKIDDFNNNYTANKAISYYTRDTFLFRLVGRAFRSEDFERIFIFRRYIIDLHWELDKLIKEQETLYEIFRLYRGKKMRTTVLQQLKDSTGAFISMNGFLSTTRSRNTALEIFAGVGQSSNDYESVLFEFCIDETTINRAYADISPFSQYPQEEEILFTIGSVWKIDSVEKCDNLYWIVQLSSCNNDTLRINQLSEELANDSTLLMLGDVLRELGQHTKAENFYNKMLDEPTTKDKTRVILYYNIAMLNMEQGKDPVALENLHKAEKLISVNLVNTESFIFQPLYSSSIVSSSIHLFNNMGILYGKKGDSNKALQYFIKAVNAEGSDQIDKAKVHANIGLLHYSKGNYQTAREHLLEAVRLAQDHSSLPTFKQHYDAVNNHFLSKDNPFEKKLKDCT